METPPILPTENPTPAPENPELRQWTLITHLSGLVGLAFPCFGNVLAPLVVWLIKKQELPGLEPIGKTVLNFQISWSIWLFASLFIAFAGSCFVIPILLPFGFGVAWLIFTIIGSIKASNGEPYAYPLTLRFLQ
jgi:uncharacterized Tic20 family protein